MLKRARSGLPAKGARRSSAACSPCPTPSADVDDEPDGRIGLESELAERLDSVLGIAERLAASHDREDLFRTIVDETKRALRVDYVTIRILRDDQLYVAAWAGLPDDLAAALPAFGVGEGWVGEVLRTGRAAAWTDTRTDRRYGSSKYDGILEFAGDLIAPLMHHDRVIGALSAVTREPREWTDGDVAFLTTLATHAAIALTNAELFEQTEAKAAQLAVLQAASGRLNRATSVEAVGRARRRGDPPDHRLPQRARVPHRVARPGRADRLRGSGRRLRARRSATCCAAASARASPAGSRSMASRC